MATKVYKVVHPQGRAEVVMLFLPQEQQTLEKDLARMKEEGLISDFIIQTPGAKNVG